MPRSEGASEADLKIVGRLILTEAEVNAAGYSGVVRLSAKLSTSSQDYVDGEEIDASGLTPGEPLPFAMTLRIPVRRTDHTLTLEVKRANGTTKTLSRAERLVAGDMYVIGGQSNAIADGNIEAEDVDYYVRGYNPADRGSSKPYWTEARSARAGLWMGRTAARITRQTGVPIGVFNYGVGGKNLAHFEPGSPSGVYEAALAALDEAGVLGRVHTFFWHQGEADGFGISVYEYKRRLADYFELQRSALGTRRVYIAQTTPFTCDAWTANIPEAQRRLIASDPNLTGASTTYMAHRTDGCHYTYGNGHERLGDRFAELLLNDAYGADKAGVETPRIDSARITGAREITAYFTVPGSQLVASGNPWADFGATGIRQRAISGRVQGNTAIVTFDTAVASATGFSYFGSESTTARGLHNARGVGAFMWTDISLTPGDGAVGNLPDAELTVARLTNPNQGLAAGQSTDIRFELRNAGRSTLTGAVVEVKLPEALRYPNGGSRPYAGVVSTGEFEVAIGRWQVPTLRPNDVATLTLTVRAGSDGANGAVVWGQVIAADQRELDSQPADASLGEVRSDDEARLVIGQPSQSCSLSSALLNSRCEADDAATWKLEFAVDANERDDVRFSVSPSNALISTDAPAGKLRLDFDVLAAAGSSRVNVRISRSAGEFACDNEYMLEAPATCKQTPVVCVQQVVLDTISCERYTRTELQCCDTSTVCATVRVDTLVLAEAKYDTLLQVDTIACDSYTERRSLSCSVTGDTQLSSLDTLILAAPTCAPLPCDTSYVCTVATRCDTIICCPDAACDTLLFDATLGTTAARGYEPSVLQLSPNPVPAGQTLRLVVPVATEPREVVVFGMLGVSLASKIVVAPGETEVRLPTESLAPGIYVVWVGRDAAKLLILDAR